MKKKVQLSYFAVLRECAGKSHETHETDAVTLSDLYDELRTQYKFPLDASRVKAAINERYVDLTEPVEEGAQITFIPPVAGG